jgi:hypothetical protein
MSLARQIIVVSFNASKKKTIKLKMFFGSVPLEHWDGNQLQIGQDAVDIDADAHVKELNVAMHAAIPSNRECPDRRV